LKQKNELTTDIRKAGITDKDQQFFESFSDTMTKDNKKSTGEVPSKSEEQVQEYQPSESEINKTLGKAKEINSKIFKEIHPDEYKKQEDKKLDDAKKEKAWKE
jgi:hypothetical protein